LILQSRVLNYNEGGWLCRKKEDLGGAGLGFLMDFKVWVSGRGWIETSGVRGRCSKSLSSGEEEHGGRSLSRT